MALDKLVIHSTKTPYGVFIPIEDIHEEHLIKGYGKIGFADVIHFDGLIESTLEVTKDGKPYDWGIQNARHIAYMGGLSEDGFNIENTMTLEQKETLNVYVEFLKRRHPNINIVDYTNTKVVSI
mgnify:FL=1|jgi:hypothetical protein|tara:strand:+ start:93 stop:464 length:372 start_codon:yes stop_codon:yes gene_type:complete